MKNGFELMKEFLNLDNEILELSNQLSKANNISERERLSKEIDHKLSKQLVIKHKLQDINIVG